MTIADVTAGAINAHNNSGQAVATKRAGSETMRFVILSREVKRL